MSRIRFLSVALFGFGTATLLLATIPPPLRAQEAGDADEDRQRQTMERFLAILEKNPRRGSAFDRVYDYHVERGSLDRLIKTYQERTTKDPGDGNAWLLLGLLEAQRGRDAAARPDRVPDAGREARCEARPARRRARGRARGPGGRAREPRVVPVLL